MDSQQGREVASLAGARIPADHGLASLGLIMQLFGSVFLGVMALVAIAPVMAGPAPGLWMIFLIGAMGAVRSALHRAAGTSLIYGSQRGPFHATQVYIGVAAAQTVLTLLILNKEGGIPAKFNIAMFLMLMAWPLALLVLTRLPRFRRLADDLPTAEDMGFEGAAVLMSLLGVVGILYAAMQLYGMAQLPGAILSRGEVMLMLGVMIMLLIRAIMHVVAGVKGTSGIDSDGASDAAARYYNFGTVSAVVVGGVMLMTVLVKGAGGPAMKAMVPMVGFVVYLLLIWPLCLRRFFTERNFGALLEGAQGPNFRRAPDTGLTALGYLLLATGVFSLAMALPTALFRVDLDMMELMSSMTRMGGRGMGDASEALRSPWWSVGVALAQLWAAIELIGMTDRYKLAATIYGAVAGAVTIYIYLPQLEAMKRLVGAGMSVESLPTFMQLSIALVLPVGSLLLVHRKLVPTAQARVRAPSTGNAE